MDYKTRNGSNHETGTLADDQSEGLVVPRKNAPTDLLAEYQSVVDTAEVPYRFVWRLIYNGGSKRDQYEFWGTALIQTWFGKLFDLDDVKSIEAFDAQDPNPHKRPLLHIDVPADATPDILYNCSLNLPVKPGQDGVRRIYTFGYWRGGNRTRPVRAKYVHVLTNGSFIENPYRCVEKPADALGNRVAQLVVTEEP